MKNIVAATIIAAGLVMSAYIITTPASISRGQRVFVSVGTANFQVKRMADCLVSSPGPIRRLNTGRTGTIIKTLDCESFLPDGSSIGNRKYDVVKLDDGETIVIPILRAILID